jgi:hypothetical protein
VLYEETACNIPQHLQYLRKSLDIQMSPAIAEGLEFQYMGLLMEFGQEKIRGDYHKEVTSFLNEAEEPTIGVNVMALNGSGPLLAQM